jgi:hypothetical protein
MTRKILLLLILTWPVLANSQINPFHNDQSARLVYKKSEELNMEGSPFLYDEYLPAEITLVHGGVFPGIKVKLNIVDNELQFLTDDGREMATPSPVKSIKFERPKEDGSGTEQMIIESNGAALNAAGSPVYQLLADGNARLLKQIEISFSDTRKYPEGTMVRVFKKKTFYFAAMPDQPAKKFDKGKSNVLALFPAKQQEISSFIESQKLNCKTEDDIIKVFKYYNTLK